VNDEWKAGNWMKYSKKGERWRRKFIKIKILTCKSLAMKFGIAKDRGPPYFLYKGLVEINEFT
jgi:hypothetical protein